MTNVIRIERDVEENLNDVGLAKEGETWLVYKVLFHLFVADEMLRKMSKYQFGNAKFWYGRVFRALFVRKLLRETKKTKKSSLPPAPPTIVKETTKEITETYLPIKKRRCRWKRKRKHSTRNVISSTNSMAQQWSTNSTFIGAKKTWKRERCSRNMSVRGTLKSVSTSGRAIRLPTQGNSQTSVWSRLRAAGELRPRRRLRTLRSRRPLRGSALRTMRGGKRSWRRRGPRASRSTSTAGGLMRRPPRLHDKRSWNQ